MVVGVVLVVLGVDLGTLEVLLVVVLVVLELVLVVLEMFPVVLEVVLGWNINQVGTLVLGFRVCCLSTSRINTNCAYGFSATDASKQVLPTDSQ